MLPMLRTNFALSPLATRGLSGIDSLFDRFFGEDLDLNRPGWGWGFIPISVWQDDHNVYVEADLPGVTENDVEVTVKSGVLTMKAERRDEQSREYSFNGRTFGRLERAVVLPDSVDSDHVEAKLANGVLSVTLPKHVDARPKRIAVKSV